MTRGTQPTIGEPPRGAAKDVVDYGPSWGRTVKPHLGFSERGIRLHRGHSLCPCIPPTPTPPPSSFDTFLVARVGGTLSYLPYLQTGLKARKGY